MDPAWSPAHCNPAHLPPFGRLAHDLDPPGSQGTAAPQAGEHAGAVHGRPAPLVPLSRWIWKNGECRAKRAASISTRPAATTPASDQTCDAGAVCSDLTRTQARNPVAASGRTPRISASQALLVTRRR